MRATRENGFRPDIQGMRAIAVALVVLNHAGVPGLRGGYVGVDVFFVISGFLITGLLIHEAERTGGVSIPRFYMRRARRILPAAMLALARWSSATPSHTWTILTSRRRTRLS